MFMLPSVVPASPQIGGHCYDSLRLTRLVGLRQSLVRHYALCAMTTGEVGGPLSPAISPPRPRVRLCPLRVTSPVGRWSGLLSSFAPSVADMLPGCLGGRSAGIPFDDLPVELGCQPLLALLHELPGPVQLVRCLLFILRRGGRSRPGLRFLNRSGFVSCGSERYDLGGPSTEGGIPRKECRRQREPGRAPA